MDINKKDNYIKYLSERKKYRLILLTIILIAILSLMIVFGSLDEGRRGLLTLFTIISILLLFPFILFIIKLSQLNSKNLFLKTEMKGYKKQLKKSGISINVANKDESKDLNIDSIKSKGKLLKLKELYNEDLITEEEYNRKRKEIISKI